MTTPSGDWLHRDFAVILRHWANDRQLFDWAIDWLILGKRPAIALLFLFLGDDRANDWLVLGERPTIALFFLRFSCLLAVDYPGMGERLALDLH